MAVFVFLKAEAARALTPALVIGNPDKLDKVWDWIPATVSELNLLL